MCPTNYNVVQPYDTANGCGNCGGVGCQYCAKPTCPVCNGRVSGDECDFCTGTLHGFQSELSQGTHVPLPNTTQRPFAGRTEPAVAPTRQIRMSRGRSR